MRQPGQAKCCGACPRGGANDGGYRKPHLGNYGYPERAVYALSAVYRPVCAWVDSPELLWGWKPTLPPTLYGTAATKRQG